jgi:hypothetical protein
MPGEQISVCRSRASYLIPCEAYTGNSPTDGRRKLVEDLHGGIQPPHQSIIATPQLVEPRDLQSQCVDDIVRRTASLKSVKWWTQQRVFPCFLFIGLSSIVKDGFVVRTRGNW